MTRVCSPKKLGAEEHERAEKNAQIEALGRDTFEAIEAARSKMTPEERGLADREADAIITNALLIAARSRRRA